MAVKDTKRINPGAQVSELHPGVGISGNPASQPYDLGSWVREENREVTEQEMVYMAMNGHGTLAPFHSGSDFPGHPHNSGWFLTGSYQSGALNTPRASISSSAGQSGVDFNGSNEYFKTPSVAHLNFDLDDAFSISAWVSTGSTYDKDILSKITSADAYRGWQFKISQGYLMCSQGYKFGWPYNFMAKKCDDMVGIVNDHSVYHVCWTKNGTDGTSIRSKLYVNGVSASANAITNGDTATTAMSTSHDVEIGRANWGEYWDGYIAHVSVWDKELSAAEVVEIYNNGQLTNLKSHSTADNLVSYWKTGDGDDNHGSGSATNYDMGAGANYGRWPSAPSTMYDMAGTSNMTDTNLTGSDVTFGPLVRDYYGS